MTTQGLRRLSVGQKLFVLAVLAFTVGPFAPLLIQSFAFRWAWPDLMPSVWWFEQRQISPFPLAWDYVLSPTSQVLEATVNTVGIGVAVTVVCLIICLPAARVLARGHFRGKRRLEFVLSLPLLVPEAAIGIALLMIFIGLGISGTYPGVIVVHLIPTVPYMLRMLTAVYQELDAGYEDCGRVLGANEWQVLTRITLPLLLPGVLAGALFTFLVSTNLFLLTFFIGQGKIVTLPTLLFSQISGGAMGATAAGIALIASIPGLILLVLSDRLIREEAFALGIGDT